MPHAAPPHAANPVSAVWRRDTNAWVLDDTIIGLQQPPLNRLVPIVLSWSPVPLILSTCSERAHAAWIAKRLLDRTDPLDFDPLEPIADEIVDHWFGMPRWTVQRLWKEAISGWRELDGTLGARGVDVLALPPDRATNIVYGVLSKWRDPKDVPRWRTKLNEPPARVLHADTGAEAAAFDWAAAAALAGMPTMAMPTTPVAGVDSQITRT